MGLMVRFALLSVACAHPVRSRPDRRCRAARGARRIENPVSRCDTPIAANRGYRSSPYISSVADSKVVTDYDSDPGESSRGPNPFPLMRRKT